MATPSLNVNMAEHAANITEGKCAVHLDTWGTATGLKCYISLHVSALHLLPGQKSLHILHITVTYT